MLRSTGKTDDGAAVAAPLPRPRRIALAGNPNVGKTTVFNQLTGMHQRVGNYPGVTVEKKVGRTAGPEPAEVIDLPGTYSLNPSSLDEQVVYDVLVGRVAGEPQPDLVVCVVDATNLERNLFLVSQVMDLGLPTVVAVNMMDEAEKAGLVIDTARLELELGVPVVSMVAARGTGVQELKDILRADPPLAPSGRWELPAPVAAQVDGLMEVLRDEDPSLSEAERFSEAVQGLSSDRILEARRRDRPAFYEAVVSARQALEREAVTYRQAETRARYAWISPIVERVTQRPAEDQTRTFSDRVDDLLLQRVYGPVIFLGVLLLIFQAIFSWAAPAMDLIELGVGAVSGLVVDVLPDSVVRDLLVDGVIAGVGNVLVFLPQILLLFFFLGLMEDTGYMARTSLIMDRVMRKVGLSGGSVVPLVSSFACAVPGIMAARTMGNHRDRLVTILVAPLMSCSARLPVYTLFIAAFIPSERLLGPLGLQGVTMFGMYMLGTVMAFAAATILRKFVVRGTGGYFVTELPPYRRPQLKLVLTRMIQRARMFVRRAGKIIFAMSIVLWFMASYPKAEDPALEADLVAAARSYEDAVDSVATAQGTTAPALLDRAPVQEAMRLARAAADAEGPEAAGARAALQEYERRAPAAVDAAMAVNAARQRLEARQAAVADAAGGYQIRHSFIGWIGRQLEPVMAPLGFDWKINAGIISAFAAREVIISTLATIYNVGDADESSVILKEALLADRDPETGEPVYTPLVALSLLVFFVLAMQCMSTLAVARRELNSWLWPAFMWAYMTGLAYLLALVVYQGGRLLGFG